MNRLLARALSIVVGVVVVGVGLGACREEQIRSAKREVWIDGAKVEDVDESSRINARGGELVQRFHTAVGAKDVIQSLATIDKDGFVTGASYRREGPYGKKYVELRHWDKGGPNDGKLVLFSRGDDEVLVLPDLPVIVLEVMHHLKPVTATDQRPKAVVIVDVEHASFAVAERKPDGTLVDAKGAPYVVGGAIGGRVEIDAGQPPPPPAPYASQDGAVLVHDTDRVAPAHTERAPFIESSTAKVTSWCKQQASAASSPVEAAKAVALAVKPKLRRERASGTASAQWTVANGAWDEGGAALLVACLRSTGRPARVVSGTAIVSTGSGGDPEARGDSQAAETRTWAQVHDGTKWVDVDACDIDVDGKMHDQHIALVEGFRGPLTTGLAIHSPRP